MIPLTEATRQFCYRCFKPTVVCICNTITQVNNHTRIQILQHPLERNHPIGTARFAALGLKNATLKTIYADRDGSLGTRHNCTGKTGLLFPSPNARDLETLPPEAYPDTLIVLDGTWYNAAKLYRENQWLGSLPHYRLSPESPSRYRIRMEPTRDSISTLEAIVAALRILEPETDCSNLLNAFDEMINRQIAFMDGGNGIPRRKRPRKRKKNSVPYALVNRFQHTVVVYTENIRIDMQRRAAASICATRMGDGETFEAFIRLPSEWTHRLDELDPSGILDRYHQDAQPLDTVLNQWQAFIQPNDIMCSWNKGTLQSLFQISGFPARPYFFLKAAYGNMVKQKFGTLEDVIKELNIVPVENNFHGRSAQRISNAIAIATWLHQKGIA